MFFIASSATFGSTLRILTIAAAAEELSFCNSLVAAICACTILRVVSGLSLTNFCEAISTTLRLPSGVS